ncbi:MAG: insulinase family protein [bacterium]|nr:insulinase family protein [bacterium]
MKHSVKQVELSNGSKGLFVHIPDATVMTYEINFRAGEYLLERNKWETAHLMEHVLLGANELYPRARDFQEEVEKNGAYSNASTNVYDITYEAECADFEWDRILSLIVLAITKPLFLQSEFEAEFGNVREELSAHSNNHFRHLSLALREAYGMLSMRDHERLEKMQNVTVDDVRSHYKATHTSDNMRFVVAGNITPERQDALTKIFETIDLEKGVGRKPLPKEFPVSINQPLYIEQPGVDNVYFYLDTYALRWLRNSEIDALSMANNMLTGTLHSKILGAARELGLVYGMSSNYSRSHDASNWWFGAQIRPENVTKVFEIMNREIMRVRTGKISDKDVVMAKQYALGSFQRSDQTVFSTGNGYSRRFFYDDELDDYYAIPKRIESVTKESIVSVANTLFDNKVHGFGVLGTCGRQFVVDTYKSLDELW